MVPEGDDSVPSGCSSLSKRRRKFGDVVPKSDRP